MVLGLDELEEFLGKLGLTGAAEGRDGECVFGGFFGGVLLVGAYG